jgi:hypothetical protein
MCETSHPDIDLSGAGEPLPRIPVLPAIPASMSLM